MANRRFSIKFSGVKTDAFHDGQMAVKYFVAFSNVGAPFFHSSDKWPSFYKVKYSDIFPSVYQNEGMKDSSPMVCTYTADESFDLSTSQGLCALEEGVGNKYSIYRREYEIYERPGNKISGYYNEEDGKFYEKYEEGDDPEYSEEITGKKGWFYSDKSTGVLYSYDGTNFPIIRRVKEYVGDWEPVVVKSDLSHLYDFNITSGRSYQYILYPADTLYDNTDAASSKIKQVFANSISNTESSDKIIYKVWQPNPDYEGQGKFVTGTVDTANKLGEALPVSWDAWSICELEPISSDDDIPVVKNSYKVNLDQIWAFKYSLETGSQAQNISRSETQTLGQFPKIGFGPSNYASGSVSALLGSEIVPYGKQRYLERLRSARVSPLSTNEKAKMLAQWKKFVSSKNPKLLKDIKGQSWIVQIVGSSSTPKNFYMNQPDTIEFQWKQVEDTKNVVIYSETGDLKAQSEAKGEEGWEPLLKNGKNFQR